MTLSKEKIKEEAFKAEFLSELKQLLDPQNSKGTFFLNFIQRTLSQQNLQHVDIQEIIQDATAKALVYIETESRKIDNPSAWMRSACKRVINDMVEAESELQDKSILTELAEIHESIACIDTRITQNQTETRQLAKETERSLSKLKVVVSAL